MKYEENGTNVSFLFLLQTEAQKRRIGWRYCFDAYLGMEEENQRDKGEVFSTDLEKCRYRIPNEALISEHNNVVATLWPNLYLRQPLSVDEETDD